MRDSPVQARPERLFDLPNEPPLGEGNTSRSGQDNMKLLELMDIYTKLPDKVTTLENKLTSTKAVYNTILITLTKKVKKFEKKLKHKRKRAVIDSLEDEEANDDETHVEILLNIKRSASKDKGKSIMQESEPPKKIKKKEMMQISLDEEISQSDEARLDQENLAQAEQWDDVQAQI
nr:hypothetical protein [Tanacetum cinerariifolium]